MAEYKFLILLIFCSLTFSVNGQIAELRDKGVLIIRLESGNNKFKAINEKIESGDNISFWKDKKEEVSKSIQLKNKIVMKAFTNNYQFSAILFMYDTSSVALKNGQASGIFLNQQLEIDRSIQLKSKRFLVLSEGLSESGSEGFYVMDQQLEPLKRPLPRFIKLNTVGLLFNNILDPKEATNRMYSKAAARVEKKFKKYLAK